MPFLFLAVCMLGALLILRLVLGNVIERSKLELGFSSVPGKRQINADNYDWAYYKDEVMLVLADGIGSARKGRTAAEAAVHTLSRVFEITGAGNNPVYFFRQAFQGANAAVLRYIPDGTAGASLLGAVVRGGKLYYALAGNCKIAVYRGGELIPLSDGHSVDVLARQAFERRQISRSDALESIQKKRVYNFVGKDGFKDLELFDVPVALKRGDIIVMMTDGVFEFCTAGQLESILDRRESTESKAQRITQLLEQKNDPEQDNATVILAKVNA